MIYYGHEKEIQIELLCRICHKICDEPTSCPQCRSLYCLDCLDNYLYWCYSCAIEESQNQRIDKVYKLDPYSNQFLDKIKCLCYYCNTYILYKKYRKHKFNCKLIKTNFNGYNHRIKIYNSEYEEICLYICNCNECQIKEVKPLNCNQCTFFMIRKSDLIMNQEDRGIYINGNLELEQSESQYNIKFCCVTCNIFIKYADLTQHQLKCINNRNRENKKQIRKLKSNVERLEQTKCYLKRNDIYLFQNYKENTLQSRKYLKIKQFIECELPQQHKNIQ